MGQPSPCRLTAHTNPPRASPSSPGPCPPESGRADDARPMTLAPSIRSAAASPQRRSSWACAHPPQLRHMRHQTRDDPLRVAAGLRGKSSWEGEFSAPAGCGLPASFRVSLEPVGSVACSQRAVAGGSRESRVLAAGWTAGSGGEVEGARDASTRWAWVGCRGGRLSDRGRRASRGGSAGDAGVGRRGGARPAARPGGQAPRGRDGADAGLQRVHPGSHGAGASGLGDRRAGHQRRRHGHHRALAWAAAGEQVRRGAARDAATDPGGRQLHLPAQVPRRRPVLVPPAHPGGLRPGTRPVRQHHRRPRRARLLAAGPPGDRPHPGRPAARGRQDRAVQPVGDQLRGDGPIRQRAADRR